MAKLKKEQENATLYLPGKDKGINISLMSPKELDDLSKKIGYEHLFEIEKKGGQKNGNNGL